MSAAATARGPDSIFRGLVTMLAGARRYPRAASAAALLGIVNGASMVLGALAIAYATDVLVIPAAAGQAPSGQAWIVSVAAIVGISIVRWATIVSRGVMTARVQYRCEADTRRSLLHRYLELGLAWQRRHTPGRLLAHAVSDAEAMWSPMQWAYFAIGNVTMLLLAMVGLVARDPLLGVVGALLVVVVLSLNVLYQRRLRPRTHAVQEARARVAGVAHESIDGGEVVRALGLAQTESERFGGPVEQLREANRRMSAISSSFDPILELLPTIAILGVLATAPARVEAGHLSVGDLVGVVYLLITIAIPLNVLSRFLSTLPLSSAGKANIDAVLFSDAIPSSGPRDLSDPGPLRVEVEAVGLTIGDAILLDDVSLRLAPGTVTALVGEVGSGKSTLLEVVGGLLAPSTGRVLLDGTDIQELAPGVLPRAAAYVPQTAFLFAVSIRENLVLDASEYSDEDLWEALRLAVADEFVRNLPNGIDTVVGARGATLSGGQRQRITIARALLARPRLLLLDDPTSALDARVEHELLANLAAVAARRATTILLVANRQGTIALAERVVLLASGRVAAEGTHRQLGHRVDYRRIVTAYGDGARGAAEWTDLGGARDQAAG